MVQPQPMTDWLSADELKFFKKVGRGCKVSRGATIYGAQNIELADNVRIDTGVLLAVGGEGAWLSVGSHTHIAARAILSCGGGIQLGSFSTVGYGSKLISASDSFGGDCLVGPMISEKYTKVKKSPIHLEHHAIVTTDCTLLPGAVMETGSVLGAMSLLKGTAKAWGIYAGIPAVQKATRSSEASHLGDQWEREWTLLAAEQEKPK